MSALKLSSISFQSQKYPSFGLPQAAANLRSPKIVMASTLRTTSSKCHISWPVLATPTIPHLQTTRFQASFNLSAAASKKTSADSGDHDDVTNNNNDKEEEDLPIQKSANPSKPAPRRTRKNTTSSQVSNHNTIPTTTNPQGDVPQEETSMPLASSEDPTKKTRKSRKKAIPTPNVSQGEDVTKNVSRKKIDDTKDNESEKAEDSHHEEPTSHNIEIDKLMAFGIKFKQDLEDAGISFPRRHRRNPNFPPPVCCFGAALHSFIPSGRRANRLIDHSDRYMGWAPEKFVRAPGSSPDSVATVIASLHPKGNVEFMGKLGMDLHGEVILKKLDEGEVGTKAMRFDDKRPSRLSQMKIVQRDGLRATCVKPCAEDSLSISEIDIDVLKEARIFYFTSSSLLDENMRSTTLQAINISKKFGGFIFFDLNLPLLLWKSGEETKMFIQEAWDLADIIEVTKQELEFLCGIEPSEAFDTKDNHPSKFPHHKREVIMPLWHENLKVLFVTNGLSKIHCYTKEDDWFIHGVESIPLTPTTCDMSAAGDGIVAGLVQSLAWASPESLTKRKLLEHAMQFAATNGFIRQWTQGQSHQLLV